MNKAMPFLLLPLFLFSCKSNDFDLAKITLPIDSKTITSKFELKDKGRQTFNAQEFSTLDKGLLYFENESLYGSIDNSPTTSYLANELTFYIDKTSNKVEAYKLDIKTTDETKKLEQALEHKFGKTYFFYKTPKMNFRVWEDKNNTYFLEVNSTTSYNSVKTTSSYLFVVNNAYTELYEYYMQGGFQYYGDFLSEKKKNKNSNFNYKDFLKQKKAESSDYYLKNIVE